MCVKRQGQEEVPPPVPIPPESGFPGAHPACMDPVPPSRFWGSGGAGTALGPQQGCVCPIPCWAGGLLAPRRPPKAREGGEVPAAPRWYRTPRPGEVPAFLRRLQGEPGAGAGRECRGAECAPVCQRVGQPGGTPAPRPPRCPAGHRDPLLASLPAPGTGSGSSSQGSAPVGESVPGTGDDASRGEPTVRSEGWGEMSWAGIGWDGTGYGGMGSYFPSGLQARVTPGTRFIVYPWRLPKS